MWSSLKRISPWSVLFLTTATLADLDAKVAPLDEYLKKETREGFSGGVLIAKEGRIILDRVYGRAQTSTRKSFWIASISKSITAVAILKLQDQQKLSVHDSLGRFFKDVPADKKTITIHQLLTHTSGLPLQYAADGIADRDRAVRSILSLPLKQPPGKKWDYSGDGFVLLAAIIEVASGMTYEDYVRKEIFIPAGMTRSGFWADAQSGNVAPVEDPAKLKLLKSGVFHNKKGVANWGWRGSTGLYSTPADLCAFLFALKDPKLLSSSSREQMWSGYIQFRRDPEADTFNGYGWIVDIKDKQWTAVRHMGSEDELGHNGIVSMKRNGDVIVVLSNSGNIGDDAWSTRIFVGLRTLLEQSR
jgi:CubicO group peptidase (beta-lactamase class C family)